MSRGVCWVVVLGDFGRSPRMQYHAASLSKTAGYDVHVVAYGGAQCVERVASDPHIHLHLLSSPPAWLRSLPRPLALVLKAALQALALLWAMMVALPRAELVLMQCPPAVPTMALCLFACWARGSRLIIDWHNFAYSLLALSLRDGHPLVRLSLWYEKALGRLAHAHFCVTEAMQKHLAEEWGISATVLHDRPPAIFRAATVEETHGLLLRISSDINTPMHLEDCCAQAGEGQDKAITILTEKRAGGAASWRKDRPALVVSSTSWTPDEDFSLLLAAAEEYDRRCSAEKTGGSRGAQGSGGHPRLLIVVTGRGPMKEEYCRKMSRLRLSKAAFRTAWLEPEDYPLLLGSADLGVSLHTSSSGLDLPMKVVDMFGCSLPVCSADYACIQELVKPGVNGRLFSTPEQLADHLMDLFKGFPESPSPDLALLRQNLADDGKVLRWDENWEENAMPLIRGPNKANSTVH